MFCNPGKYLAVFDNDGDGYLSYKEYLEMDRNDPSKTDEEQTNDIFLDEYNSFDYDHDGYISRDELFDNMKCWATSVAEAPAAMMDLYMIAGDRNGDARIGFAEWNFLKFFYMIDNNPKDGFLSKEEFAYFLTTMNMSWDFDSFDDDNDGGGHDDDSDNDDDDDDDDDDDYCMDAHVSDNNNEPYYDYD